MPAFVPLPPSTFFCTQFLHCHGSSSIILQRKPPVPQPPRAQQQPNPPTPASSSSPSIPPKPPLTLNTPPKRPSTRSSEAKTPEVASTPQTPALKRPNDPTPMRTESQRRRNSPPHSVRRPRRRRRSSANDLLDWERAESVPLAASSEKSSSSGEDYWMELKPFEEVRERRRRRMKYTKRIDEDLKYKLKKEVISPYANNWILWFSLIVFALVVLVKVLGTDMPIISIPDV